MRHQLIIDGNSIAHANHNGTKLTVGGFEVQAIFGFLRSLRAMVETAPGDVKPIVLWDGRAQFRYDLWPDYKGNRAATNAEEVAKSDARKKQMPYIEAALLALGVPQLRHPDFEADDLAGHLVKAMPHVKKTLVSGDRDWIQLIDADTTWFDPIRDRRVTPTNLLEFSGYHDTAAYVQGKALVGDGSDNIPGVGGIGETGAPIFLAKWGSVQAFFDAVDAGNAGKLTKKHAEFAMPEGRKRFARNMALMDLRNPPPIKGDKLVISKAPPAPHKFEAICQRLAFASILRDMPRFLQTFGIEREDIAA